MAVTGSRALTFVGEVIHEDELHQQVRGRAVKDAVYGAQEGAPSLVVEAHDDAGRL